MLKQHRYLRSLLGLAIVLTACSPPQASACEAGKDAHARRARDIAASRAPGAFEIWVMQADGSAKRRLTKNRAGESSPAWSPDGSRIAFATDRDGNSEIYVMMADGSRQTRLTADPGSDDSPSWSPDGRRIAFTRRLGTGDGTSSDVYTVEVSTRVERRLTRHPGRDEQPRWSPDGRWIAYSSDEAAGDMRTHLMKPDGSTHRPLTQTISASPSFSPDGSRVVYADYGHDIQSEDLYVIGVDGRGKRALTLRRGSDSAPAWSSRSDRIAWSTDRDGSGEIYAVKPDGSQERRLTCNTVRDDSPKWSPDGSRIAFERSFGESDIVVMDADGEAEVRLTDQPGPDTSLEWSPDGRQIVYVSAPPVFAAGGPGRP